MADYPEIRAKLVNCESINVSVRARDLLLIIEELDALRIKAGKPVKPPSGYSPEFEEAWSAYPTRPGMSKAAAYVQWCARIKAGCSAEEMIAGTRKYAAYVKAENTEAHFIKLPATFYGRGMHFDSDWTVKQSALGSAGQATALAAFAWINGR